MSDTYLLKKQYRNVLRRNYFQENNMKEGLPVIYINWLEKLKRKKLMKQIRFYFFFVYLLYIKYKLITKYILILELYLLI